MNFRLHFKAAFSYISLEDKHVNLFPVCFYFPRWPPNNYPVSLRWFFLPEGCHFSWCHLLDSHPRPPFPCTAWLLHPAHPENAVWRLSYKFFTHSENIFQAFDPSSDFSRIWLSRPQFFLEQSLLLISITPLSWLSSDLSAFFQLNFQGFPPLPSL